MSKYLTAIYRMKFYDAASTAYMCGVVARAHNMSEAQVMADVIRCRAGVL